jgi:GT2 family glycosyltransferase
MMSLSLTAVICTRNRPVDLLRALQSLDWQETKCDEIIVIDDSDPDRRMETTEVCSRTNGTTRILTKEVPGLTASRNLGIQESRSDLTLFIDDDVVLRPDYVTKMITAFEQDDRLAGAIGSIDDDHDYGLRWLRGLLMVPGMNTGRVYRSGWASQPPRRSSRPVEWLMGCNMMYRTSVLRRYRFNDQFLGYALGEDAEFSHRLHLDGHRLASVGDAHVWHITSLPQSDGAWGYREVAIRPLIAGRRFSKLAFLISSSTFLVSNMKRNRERARGNARGMADVLRGRPIRDVQAVRKLPRDHQPQESS